MAAPAPEAQDRTPALVAALRALEQQERAAQAPFKARAYAKVRAQIEALPHPVTALADLAQVTGVGDSIRAKLQEILATGTTAAIVPVDPRVAARQASLDALAAVMGIGPVKAKELVDRHHVASVEALRQASAAQPDLLNDKQKLGLKHHDDIQARIPRAEMDKHAAFLQQALLAGADGGADATDFVIAGSYRRGRPDSGDIDVLLRGTDDPGANAALLQRAVETLVKAGYLTDLFAHGDKKAMAMARLPRHKRHRRIDLLVCAPQQFPFALLYFTGSQTFNIQMRQAALALGYSLNEYGLTPAEDGKVPAAKPLPPDGFRTEQDVFDFLGMAYVAPTAREAQGKTKTNKA